MPVTPAGWPESVKETGEAKPPVDVICTVKLPDCPLVIAADEGETEIVKSGAGKGLVTVKVTSAL